MGIFLFIDNTSKDFLVNHFGEAHSKSISILKNRYAIISGKAFVSNVPMMFKVPDINEEEPE